MSETLLTFAVEEILEKVGLMAIRELAGAWRLKKDLRKLSELIESVHAKLREARDNQVANGRAVKPLLIKLQDVLYSAEDLLDDFSYEILRRQIEIPRQPRLKVRGFVSRKNPILFQLKMASKVKKINQSLKDIKQQALREFVFTGKAVADPAVVSNYRLDRETVSFFDKSAPPVIGRASEMEAIINLLQMSFSTPSLLTVVSIVGFGGLGKTTLARMVFHEVKKTKLFDEAMWVYVSQPFDVKEILKGMLQTLDITAGGLDNTEAILRHLEKKLENKRFFLVLDDIWEDNHTRCNSLKSHLLTICNKAGNFVILTTRNINVAKAMDTQDEHVVPLKELEDNECWDIIRGKCLMQWGGSMPEELEQIGLDVAKKCKGVPLAAKVIGGTLCYKKNSKEWLSIKDSDAWEKIDEDKQIFPVLKLSFDYLDPSLKQCFVYCSLFSKDFKYNKEQLIQLWMAEGFLNTTSTNGDSSGKSMEAVGDECFNGLIVHSFFQDVQVNELGNIISCKMHDLLHDLAISASNYKMLNLNDSRCFFRTSNHQRYRSVEELVKDGARNVRFVICKADVSHMFSTFKSLRSLDISNAGLNELPSTIGSLKHLRYLDISKNLDITELPEFITKLYNLQTLRINGCWRIRVLPTNMVNLVRLRHIHFDNHYLYIYNIGCLTELRTLPHFEVRPEEGFRIEELKGLNELRGILTIAGLANVRDREEAEEANLKGKKLTELNLDWGFSFLSYFNDENVLEGLLPRPTIKRLTIRRYNGVKFPNWMSMGINNSQCQLTQLVELSLLDCGKCKIMPSLGHLPCLKILKLSGLNNMVCIGSAFYGECKRKVTLFPALKNFFLQNMNSLVEWAALVAIEGDEQISVEVFPLLEELYIRDCPRLRSIPLRHLSSLVRVSIESCGDMEYLSNDFQNLPCLDDLLIEDCTNLVSLSCLQDLKSLKRLLIRWCVGLTSLSKGLVSLETLEIVFCGDLSLDAFSGLSSLKCLTISRGCMESIPNVEHPGNLEELSIDQCPKVTSVPRWIKFCTSLRYLYICDCERLISINDDIFGSLTKLKKLTMGPFSEELEKFPGLNSIHMLSVDMLEIRGWPKLKSLPQQLQHLTTLKELIIRDFKGVETLPDWLGNLSSLQKLRLQNCDKMENLPQP